MNSKPLIPRDQIVGVFRGFSGGGLEFHADLALPYRPDYHQRPLHGHFLLIELDGENEAVLGRITSLLSEGRLVSSEGEDYLYRQARDGKSPPEDIREQYLKYRVNIRVLGVIRKKVGGEFDFVASHRRIPHVGSPVVFPSDEVLREIANHNGKGAPLGFLAMGEFVWAGREVEREIPFQSESWMRIQSPQVIVRFPVKNLISRRSFVFARAGFGKSNLVKLLFSELYKETPTVPRRGGEEVPVGTIIFDRDGEYFWPDHKGRPGLCDVPHLQHKLVVFTSRKAPSNFYGSFVAAPVKLDIRRLPAEMVVGIALSPERQDQQNVRKLKALSRSEWKELVDIVNEKGNNAPLEDIKTILKLDASSDVEAIAARSNVYAIVRMLHDPNSRLLDYLLNALKEGKLCVVDLSMLSGEVSLVISGLILQHIFNRNQEEFTTAEARTIPVIAVLEEAQSVLGHGANLGNAPYVTWVKEGRKYDLGAVLITQQPGSISNELLSQGDNWFIFHLLSAGDLRAVKQANAHFSDDILSSLLNEPIPGHCIFWSTVDGKPYPLPIRVLSFEGNHTLQDASYSKGEVDTFAKKLKELYQEEFKQFGMGDNGSDITEVQGDNESDYLTQIREFVIESLPKHPKFLQYTRDYGSNKGVFWAAVLGIIEELIPESLDDRSNIAKSLIEDALNKYFGDDGWTAEKDDNNKLRIFIEQDRLNEFLSQYGGEE